MLSVETKRKLDAFGPYGSAIGAGLGYSIYLLVGFIEINTGKNIWISNIPFTFILPYFLCTCAHRKYLIYSPGALGGLIGTLIGFFSSGLLLIPIFMAPSTRLGGGVIQMLVTGVSAFFFSKYMCNRARRKEPLNRVSVSKPTKENKKPTKEPEKPKPKNLSDYDTDEKCPSCSYEFTNYATIEPKQKTIEVICPHCHHIFKKRITKKMLKEAERL